MAGNTIETDQLEQVVTYEDHAVVTPAKPIKCERSQLYICDLLEPNTAIFDEEEDYLKQTASQSVECPTELYSELLTSYDSCEKMFHLALYQQILYNESRVRLKPGNDIYSNKGEIEKIHLSLNMKKFLVSVSQMAYSLLKKENLLGDFIELDSENEEIVTLKGKQRSVNFHTNVLSLINKSKKLDEADKMIKTNEAKLSNRTKKYRFPRRGEKANINARTFGVTKLETDYDITESEDSDESDGPENVNVTLTFVLTVRNSLPAVKVLEQCISNISDTKSKKYILACHIGPMVEEQHIALYKHRCSQRYNNGIFETKNIDKIMQIWDKTKGQTTFVMSDPKESLKYSIYNPLCDEDDENDTGDDDEGSDDEIIHDNGEFQWKLDNSDSPVEELTFNTKSLCFSSKALE